MKKVKIIATLGPACDTPAGIERLAEEGVDVFRLNFSHYSTEDGVAALRRVRQVEKKIGRPLAVFGDLAGPKIRIGDVEKGIRLKEGELVHLVKKPVKGTAQSISLNFPAILDLLERGAEIFLADGLIRLEAERKGKDSVIARVKVGGELRSRMGFSAHGIALSKFVLTPADRTNIRRMAEEGVDALAVSFVQTAKDIALVRRLLGKKDVMLIAKIETKGGVGNAESILDEADAMMIARGDMGFSMPLPELPHIQKRLIRLAREKAKPVITATQMLESMIHASFPTRAEVTDVANAILDGTDAVMLSAESAIGKFPFETVRTMRKIITGAVAEIPENFEYRDDVVSGVVSGAAVDIAERAEAKLLIAFTESGSTARRISRFRPRQPILALSPNLQTIRRLCFSWGVYPFPIRREKYFYQLLEQAKKIATANPILRLRKGDRYVIAAGIPAGRAGSTNAAVAETV